jgi:hypothetical protein
MKWYEFESTPTATGRITEKQGPIGHTGLESPRRKHELTSEGMSLTGSAFQMSACPSAPPLATLKGSVILGHGACLHILVIGVKLLTRRFPGHRRGCVFLVPLSRGKRAEIVLYETNAM